MSLEGLTKEEAFNHGWELATQRAISRAELGLPLVATPDYDAWVDREVASGYPLLPYRDDTIPTKELKTD